MDYSPKHEQRFVMIKSHLKEYLKIVLMINEMSFYQIRDLFESYSKTAAFDYLKYSKLIEHGGVLLRSSNETTRMKYNKYFLKIERGTIIIDKKIHSYDFDSFFGSIYMESSKDKTITFAKWLHMEALKISTVCSRCLS